MKIETRQRKEQVKKGTTTTQSSRRKKLIVKEKFGSNKSGLSMLSRSLLAILMVAVISIFAGGYMIPEVRIAPNNNKFGKFILEKCDILRETFSPTWWAGSALLQTIVPSVMRSRLEQMKYTREMLNCQDGGTVSLDWYEGSPSSEIEDSKPGAPIAIMFPGLLGDSQSEYLRYIVPAVHKLGYRVASFNNRGRGGMELKTPRIYWAANFDDLELALDHVREKNPSSRIIASGFSLGGIVLTRYLGERGDKAKVDAAMLISANYDLVNGTKNMENGYIHRFVGRLMTKALADALLSHKDVLVRANKPVEWDKMREATSFRELDRYFTCPMFGYNDPEDFFRDATNMNRVPRIKVPTLALNAGDDIFSPYETLPPTEKLNEAVVFVITRRGGHLGFMDGWKPTAPYYGDRLIEQYHKVMFDVKKPLELIKQES